MGSAFRQQLESLGARYCATFNPNVTHLVFKGGNGKNWTKARQRNLPIVSPLWVAGCLQTCKRLPEGEFQAREPVATDSAKPRMRRSWSALSDSKSAAAGLKAAVADAKARRSVSCFSTPQNARTKEMPSDAPAGPPAGVTPEAFCAVLSLWYHACFPCVSRVHGLCLLCTSPVYHVRLTCAFSVYHLCVLCASCASHEHVTCILCAFCIACVPHVRGMCLPCAFRMHPSSCIPASNRCFEP